MTPVAARHHQCTMARTANERTTVAPARACAYALVRRVFEEAAFADQALHGEARGLEPRDRALAMRLAYGTVQRRATLDHVIERLASRPVGRLEPAVLAALRLGVFQLAFLDRVPAHAAVGEAVELLERPVLLLGREVAVQRKNFHPPSERFEFVGPSVAPRGEVLGLRESLSR